MEGNFWISLFTQKPYRTALELLKEIERTRGSISKQAVYKALRKLIERNIVTKVGENYLLSSHWLELEFKRLEKLRIKLQSAEIWHDLLQATTGDISQKFSSFLEADNYWVDLMLLLARETEAKEMLQWHPHFWFMLLQPEKEREFLEILARKKILIKAHINPRFQLDRELLKDWSDKQLELINAGDSFDKFDSTHLTLIDDFVISVSLSQRTHLQLLAAFREKHSIDREIKLQRLFSSRQSIKVRVIRSESRTQRIRDLFVSAG